MSGIRTSKTVNGVTYHYITQNGQVVRQTWGNKSLDIVYDNNNQPYYCVYNNGSTSTVYYYITNLQGDVVRLVDSNGTIKASYTYNARGKLIASSGTMASVNPIRYRGYYFDTETGFYYLQSRYYDPVTCRFINADVPENFGINFCGNHYAYCGNNPVKCKDFAGYWTVSVGNGFTAYTFVGEAYSRSVTFDGYGNVALQETYASPFVMKIGDTGYVGPLAYHGFTAISGSYTNLNSVSDTTGYSSLMGGGSSFMSTDLLMSKKFSDMSGEAVGIQLGFGSGVGVDLHVGNTLTVTRAVVKTKYFSNYAIFRYCINWLTYNGTSRATLGKKSYVLERRNDNGKQIWRWVAV